MINKQDIERKIDLLGGVTRNPSCKAEVNLSNAAFDVISYQEMYSESIPDLFKFFYEKYGPFAFTKDIGIKGLERNPIADKSNFVSVDYFYSLQRRTNCSIDSLLKIYPEFLMQKLLPICQGEPGDSICIDLRSKKIVYWDHEGPESKNLCLIAEDFGDFINRLEVRKDVHDERVKGAVIRASPELLELLRKSGFGPKGK